MACVGGEFSRWLRTASVRPGGRTDCELSGLWIKVRTTKCAPASAKEIEIGKPLDWSLESRKVQYSDRVSNPAVARPMSRLSIADMDAQESNLPLIEGSRLASSTSARNEFCRR